jgi:hypothetical protein
MGERKTHHTKRHNRLEHQTNVVANPKATNIRGQISASLLLTAAALTVIVGTMVAP